MNKYRQSFNFRKSRNQQGAAAVEFALIAAVFFSIFFGIIEFGRILHMMNTAVEATRLGARIAVVCNPNNSAINERMQAMAGFLTDENINVTYTPDGCDENDCRFVTVSITGLSVRSMTSLVPINFEMPSLSTTLPRESLTNDDNPVCI